jgi:hypothetical protein
MLKQTKENVMSKLNALNLVAYERPSNNNPTLKRRHKLVDKLNEQLRIAEDTDYQPTTLKWVTDADGERKRVEVPKLVK